MHFFAAFRELPISLLISSLALASSALPVHSTELTTDNFGQLTARGLWFIEYFSPYCGHCQDFAPTWQQLVEESERDTPAIKLAQVNCVVHGDLCNENGVKSYPTLRMYHDGESLEKYKGYRNLPDLHAFIKRHVDAIAPEPTPATPEPETRAVVNPTGEVLELTDDAFASSLAAGPMFVKFFAPWCGHCKKLAPIWKQLARHMQNKLTIAQVNCDDHGALCKANGVQGYPTLIYMTSGGLRSEYNGGRKLEQLKAFAEKASAAGLRTIKTEELDDIVKENEILYLFLHSATDSNIIETVQKAAAPLLGSPAIFTSSDPALLTRFSIPQTSTWALVAIKDHDARIPSSIHHERASSEEKLKTWLLTHRLPTTLELTQDTFQSVMNAPQAPLVFIAAATGRNKEKVKTRFREVGKKWRLRTQGSGIFSGREVVFAWMDAEKWKDWMKTMYGIKVADDIGDLEDVKVVIADHKRLVYYDKDPADAFIKIASSTSLFAAAEAAASGKLAYKNSENMVERLARYLNHKMATLETYVVAYPWRTAFFVFMIFVMVFLGLKRLIADDVPGDYRKVDRLD